MFYPNCGSFFFAGGIESLFFPGCGMHKYKYKFKNYIQKVFKSYRFVDKVNSVQTYKHWLFSSSCKKQLIMKKRKLKQDFWILIYVLDKMALAWAELKYLKHTKSFIKRLDSGVNKKYSPFNFKPIIFYKYG